MANNSSISAIDKFPAPCARSFGIVIRQEHYSKRSISTVCRLTNLLVRTWVYILQQAMTMSLTMCSDVAVQTKLALRQIYDDMTAVRDCASNLPRLLSIVDGLKPSQKRLLQSLLMHLPRRIRQDLGCYFYIFMIMGRTQSLQNPPLETSSPSDILDQWHVLEASALFSVRNMIQMPELIEEYTFVSNIGHHFPGEHNPLSASTVHQLSVRNKERLARDVCRFSELYIFPHLPGRINDAIDMVATASRSSHCSRRSLRKCRVIKALFFYSERPYSNVEVRMGWSGRSSSNSSTQRDL